MFYALENINIPVYNFESLTSTVVIITILVIIIIKINMAMLWIDNIRAHKQRQSCVLFLNGLQLFVQRDRVKGPSVNFHVRLHYIKHLE